MARRLGSYQPDLSKSPDDLHVYIGAMYYTTLPKDRVAYWCARHGCEFVVAVKDVAYCTEGLTL